MNFNIYLNKKTGERVKKIAKQLRRSRNSIVTEALEEWLSNHDLRKWPKNFFDFNAIDDVPDFKALRDDLKKLPEDPLL